MAMTASERRLRAQVAANRRWANGGGELQGRKVAAAQFKRYEARVDPDCVLAPAERARRAQHLLTSDMQALALKSAQARRRKAAQ